MTDTRALLSIASRQKRKPEGEENAKFYARLRRLEHLLSCPNWRERKNDMLTLIHKTQTNIKSQYGKYITEEEEKEEMCPQVGRNIKTREGVNGNYGENQSSRENHGSEVFESF